jgi:hypothetical protein
MTYTMYSLYKDILYFKSDINQKDNMIITSSYNYDYKYKLINYYSVTKMGQIFYIDRDVNYDNPNFNR